MESVSTVYAVSAIIIYSLGYMMTAAVSNRTFIGFRKLGE